MNEPVSHDHVIPLSLATPVWERVFTIAPLVIVGTRDALGRDNLAPKHLAMPLSWENHFGFVCTPRHRTYQNILQTGEFTVSYPRPSQIVVTSLAAAPRDETGEKPALAALPTWAASQVDAPFLADAYLFLECRLLKIIDGFGDNSLISAEIVAAFADPDAVREADRDDADVLAQVPLLAYLNWGRMARIDESVAFPFMVGFER